MSLERWLLSGQHLMHVFFQYLWAHVRARVSAACRSSGCEMVVLRHLTARDMSDSLRPTTGDELE